MAGFAGNLIKGGVKSPLYPHLFPGGGRWGIQLIGALHADGQLLMMVSWWVSFS